MRISKKDKTNNHVIKLKNYCAPSTYVHIIVKYINIVILIMLYCYINYIVITIILHSLQCRNFDSSCTKIKYTMHLMHRGQADHCLLE